MGMVTKSNFCNFFLRSFKHDTDLCGLCWIPNTNAIAMVTFAYISSLYEYLLIIAIIIFTLCNSYVLINRFY
jgi:hypothetical protein